MDRISGVDIALPDATTNGASRSPFQVRLLRAISILVGVAALASGAHAMHIEVVWVFSGPPQTPLTRPFREQLAAVTQRLPPGAFVMHLSAMPETWYSRLWERSLYPRNETVVMQPPLQPERIREIRAKYGARFAISAGKPPYDPGYLWKIRLEALPGLPGETWFGELAP